MIKDIEPESFISADAVGVASSVPAISVILVVPHAYKTVKRTIKCLQEQSAAGLMEIVFVVTLRSEVGIDESELKCFHSWQVVETGRAGSIGSGYSAGIRHAWAHIVAFGEDHAFPDSKWAGMLMAAHQQKWAAVGPGMCNGNPDTIVSWADFYQAYGEWAVPVSSGTVRHLPGHNGSYKRDVLLGLGDNLEVLMESEEILQAHLNAHGYEFYLESGTCTRHLNFTCWADWIPARFYKGRQFASTWASNWPWYRRLIFTAASPLIPLIRVWRIQKNVRRGQSTAFLLRLIPVLFLGMTFDAFGQMLGYALGAGNSIEKAAFYEYERIKTDC